MKSLEDIMDLQDPVGIILSEWDRPNGLHIKKISVPLGVIGVIYESRPNVTVDASVLCIKAGNVVILRGGSESFNSNACLTNVIQSALIKNNLDKDIVVKIDNTSFKFYSTEDSFETAWTDNDQKVVYAMKKGLELVLSGQSSRGTITNDTYTLKGFTAAINKLNKDC